MGTPNRQKFAAHRDAFAASLNGVRDLVPLATDTLRAILGDAQVPPQARIAAARVILDQATRSWDLSQKVEPRSLEDLLSDLTG